VDQLKQTAESMKQTQYGMYLLGVVDDLLEE
jgi:hypothetical protein